MTREEREALKTEILQEVEKSLKGKVIREDTQLVFKKVRDKWFKGDRSSCQSGNAKMQEVMNSFTAWASWGCIRKLTCYVCGESYVRHLSKKENIANEIAEELCQTVYRLRKKYMETEGEVNE